MLIDHLINYPFIIQVILFFMSIFVQFFNGQFILLVLIKFNVGFILIIFMLIYVKEFDGMIFVICCC